MIDAPSTAEVDLPYCNWDVVNSCYYSYKKGIRLEGLVVGCKGPGGGSARYAGIKGRKCVSSLIMTHGLG